MRIAALIAAALAGALAVAAFRPPREAAEAAPPPAADEPRSVILLIGDGMGPQQLALLMDWADAAGKGPTAFERMVAVGTIGMLRTGAEGTPLTDSASAATALSAGVEVPNGFIAMDSRGEPVRTCLEDAQLSGKTTGLVTSTRLTHATPAAFATHVPRRDMEWEIGRQLVEHSAVDVLLGGGARFLDLEEAATGYRIVTTRDELRRVKHDGQRLLGVFSGTHLPYAIDRNEEGENEAPTLAEMTKTALELLSTDKDGFFLMVEGGRIDHGGHLNDVGAVLGEMREFDDVIGLAEAFRARNPDTLVIVTADHETGGLGISSANEPLLDRHFLAMAKQKASIEALAPNPESRADVDPRVFGVGRMGFYPQYSWWETSRALVTSAKYNCSYSTQGHTTTPVPVVAAGPGASAFAGLYHNEHVGRVLRNWMQPDAKPREGR
jgi:alkaline phosphatase